MSCRDSVDADGIERAEIALENIGRRRLQDRLELVVVLQPVGVLAVAAILRPARRLHVGSIPRLRSQRAQGRGRVEGAGAHFHVVGLQDQAALACPVILQGQDQVLKALGLGGLRHRTSLKAQKALYFRHLRPFLRCGKIGIDPRPVKRAGDSPGGHILHRRPARTQRRSGKGASLRPRAGAVSAAASRGGQAAPSAVHRPGSRTSGARLSTRRTRQRQRSRS